jgi:GNAT superfamily N-acetyltransferase
MELETTGVLSAEELADLYGSVGWEAYTSDPEALARAVEASTFVVTARREGRLVGLARGLSDDVSIFYLQDILIRPEWQRQGIGRALLQACLDRFAHVRVKVLLTDDEERQHRFYEALGYRNARESGLNAFVQMAGR